MASTIHFAACRGLRGGGPVWGVLSGVIVVAVLLVGALIALQVFEWMYYDNPPSVWVQGQRRGTTGVDIPPPLTPEPEQVPAAPQASVAIPSALTPSPPAHEAAAAEQASAPQAAPPASEPAPEAAAAEQASAPQAAPPASEPAPEAAAAEQAAPPAPEPAP